jgi:hypothetical protein
VAPTVAPLLEDSLEPAHGGEGSMGGSVHEGPRWPKTGDPRWSLPELNVARAEVDKRHGRILIAMHTREGMGRIYGFGAQRR